LTPRGTHAPRAGAPLWLLGLLVAAASRAQLTAAQDRPNEADMFASPVAAQTSEPATAGAHTASDGPPAPNRGVSVPATAVFANDTATADPITIGGQLYIRAQCAALEGQQAEDFALSVPSLLDVYLDARPNDRVRGFVLGRLSYDPMLSDSASPVPSVGTSATDNGTAGSAQLSSLFGTRTNAPRALLDQFWLRFDMWHSLFVTVGRQHVRWGTARFWTPADFLHPQRRNPLDAFDARRGSDMLKLHLPIESTAWNVNAYTIFGGHNDTATVYSVSGALRAELVAGSNELGVGVLLRRGVKPRFAADLSMAVGPIDVYAEGALVDAGELDRVSYTPDAVLPDPVSATGSMSEQVFDRIRQAVDTFYPVYRYHGYIPQVVGGLSYTQSYGDNDVFTLGLEYFYNGMGYADPNVYPGLLFPRSVALRNPASFFYLGEHYAGAFIAFPGPGALDLHTFSLTTLGNISDRSFITRFDYSVQVLTHLRIEMYVAGAYGNRTGEFTFGIETPSIDGVRLGRQPATFSGGIAVRIGI